MNKILDKTSDEFGTPDEMFEELNRIYNFTIDAAASKLNHKLQDYWTKKDNALEQDWSNERVFCNPPYSRGNVEAFVMKAFQETSIQGNCPLAVLLIPTYTERQWFHELHKNSNVQIRFFRRRIQFIGGDSSARGNHMLMIFTKYVEFL